MQARPHGEAVHPGKARALQQAPSPDQMFPPQGSSAASGQGRGGLGSSSHTVYSPPLVSRLGAGTELPLCKGEAGASAQVGTKATGQCGPSLAAPHPSAW